MYRGKYPNRVQAVWTNRKAVYPALNGLYVKTNDGTVYRLTDYKGRNTPKLGVELSEIEAVYEPVKV